MMLYQDFDSGLVRERRAQMRREVEHNRLDARLAAANPGQGAGLGETFPRKSLAARGVAMVMSLLK